jgi:hypothetical protein
VETSSLLAQTKAVKNEDEVVASFPQPFR